MRCNALTLISCKSSPGTPSRLACFFNFAENESLAQNRLDEPTESQRYISLASDWISRWRAIEERINELLAIHEWAPLLSVEEDETLCDELSSLRGELDRLTQLCTPSEYPDCGALLRIVGPASGPFDDPYARKNLWPRDLANMYIAWSQRVNPRLAQTEIFGDNTFICHVEIWWSGAYAYLQQETGQHLLRINNGKPITATVEVWPTSNALDREASQAPNILINNIPGDARQPPLVSAYYRDTTRTPAKTFSMIRLQGGRPGTMNMLARRWAYARMMTYHDEEFTQRSLQRRRTYSLVEDEEGASKKRLPSIAFVRDHLFGIEHGDPLAVLQGELQPFLRAARLRTLAPLRDLYMMQTPLPKGDSR